MSTHLRSEYYCVKQATEWSINWKWVYFRRNIQIKAAQYEAYSDLKIVAQKVKKKYKLEISFLASEGFFLQTSTVLCDLLQYTA